MTISKYMNQLGANDKYTDNVSASEHHGSLSLHFNRMTINILYRRYVIYELQWFVIRKQFCENYLLNKGYTCLLMQFSVFLYKKL